MNELPIIEAYSRPDRVSVLYYIVIFILGLMVMMSIGDSDDIMEYLLILGAFIAVSVKLKEASDSEAEGRFSGKDASSGEPVSDTFRGSRPQRDIYQMRQS